MNLHLEAPDLAALIEAAITRPGELGQPGIDALVERLAPRPECPDFDTGVDLLAEWIGCDIE